MKEGHAREEPGRVRAGETSGRRRSAALPGSSSLTLRAPGRQWRGPKGWGGVRRHGMIGSYPDSAQHAAQPESGAKSTTLAPRARGSNTELYTPRHRMIRDPIGHVPSQDPTRHISHKSYDYAQYYAVVYIIHKNTLARNGSMPDVPPRDPWRERARASAAKRRGPR